MLLQPRHPDSLTTTTSTRPSIPLTRMPRQPLGSIQLAPQQPPMPQAQPPAPEPQKKPAAATAAAQPSRAKLTEQWGEPPLQIRRENVWLQRGELLGEGGFARVYLCTEPDGISYKALKVIDKQQLKSTKTKSKLFAEIKIHQAMQHPNIIAFEHCFEDDGNVYMQLELCSNGSLLDLLRARKRYTEPESRFYLTQLVGACDYMHANSVIHRDLKLGNLMLDENMDLRVGDFGLAALVKFPGERKKTICGTPNYIAPEILFDQKAGHSFEVDIWSIGVILYTLLIGRPPFQTKDVKNIYRKIRDNAYTFPSDHSLSPEAIDLISWILRPTPAERPTLAEILAHPWFITGPFPSRVSPQATDPSRAGEMVEEWRYMTKRQARENFRRVKRRAGIVEVEEAAPVPTSAEPAPSTSTSVAPPVTERVEHPKAAQLVSQALPVVAEAPEPEERRRESGEGEGRKQPRMVKREEEKEAKGRIEKEVRKATAPESPISELLRSARKPLMVSPSSRAPPPPAAFPRSSGNELQSRLAAAAKEKKRDRARTASGSSGGRSGEKENASAAAQAHVQAQAPIQASAAYGQAPDTPRSRHRRMAAQAQNDAYPSISRAPPTSSLSQPSSSRQPSSSSASAPTSSSSTALYDQTVSNFTLFLSCQSPSDLARATALLPSSTQSLVDTPQAPKVFLTSWVDYTHKYGTAYSLTDGTAGVYFNDSTTMVLSPGKEHFDYITSHSTSRNIYLRKNYLLSSSASHGSEIDRKAYLLRYFEDYMAKTLRRDVEWAWEDRTRTKNMDFLVKYYRMKNAIVFKLSNEVLQFNFYDHTKLILTSTGLILTFISPSFTLSTYSLPSLFRLAASLGYYSSSSSSSSVPTSSTEEDRTQLEEVRFLIEKVEYCRDVLRQLGERKREKERERSERKAKEESTAAAVEGAGGKGIRT
ncbi:hypothetical protein JCM11641_000725 [Rhodosporidiobolus odoratus]